MVFHTEFCEFRELRNFENFNKKSFSSGQGVVQIQPNSLVSITSLVTVYSQKVVGVACLGKKWFFIRNFANFANCEFLRILKKFFFIGSRSCPNQTKLGIEYHPCNESVKQKVVGIACLEKKWFFIRNFANFANCELLRILKKFFSIGSWSCPNQSKRSMEHHQCNESVKKKNFGRACQGKILVFIRNFANFANCEFLRIFKKILFQQVKELSKSNQTRH